MYLSLFPRPVYFIYLSAFSCDRLLKWIGEHSQQLLARTSLTSNLPPGDTFTTESSVESYFNPITKQLFKIRAAQILLELRHIHTSRVSPTLRHTVILPGQQVEGDGAELLDPLRQLLPVVTVDIC